MKISLLAVILANLINIFNFSIRLIGLKKKEYQIHPFTWFAYLLKNITAIMLLNATSNFLLASISYLQGVLVLIVLIWGSINLYRRDEFSKVWNITIFDYICIFCYGLSFITYLITFNAVTAAIIAFIGTCFGDLPTIRKVYVAPRTDKAKYFILSALKFFIQSFAVSKPGLVAHFNTWLWGLWIVFVELGTFCYSKFILKR